MISILTSYNPTEILKLHNKHNRTPEPTIALNTKMTLIEKY